MLFDLGGTLAHYYRRDEFPGVLRRSIVRATEALRQKGLLCVPEDEIWPRAQSEDHESPDNRVRPLEEWLSRIFSVYDQPTLEQLSEEFMAPIFGMGHIYHDTYPTLSRLRDEGYATALVSNTPWGSPAHLWRREVERLGLDYLLDEQVFCRDVGWRKPARQIFECTMNRLGRDPSECLFIGDDPRWDLAGPMSVGMEAVIVDRVRGSTGKRTIGKFWDLLSLLDQQYL